jgi:hypothetical protein
MRIRKRMASNNIVTDEQLAQSVVDNVVSNSDGSIHGLLIDSYFEMKEEDGKVLFSGKFEHLEIDEDTINLIRERLSSKIESSANENPEFEEKVKEAIKMVISKPNHLYNDFLNCLDDLTITDINVYVTEKRYLQQYRDSVMVTFYVDMETL